MCLSRKTFKSKNWVLTRRSSKRVLVAIAPVRNRAITLLFVSFRLTPDSDLNTMVIFHNSTRGLDTTIKSLFRSGAQQDDMVRSQKFTVPYITGQKIIRIVTRAPVPDPKLAPTLLSILIFEQV